MFSVCDFAFTNIYKHILRHFEFCRAFHRDDNDPGDLGYEVLEDHQHKNGASKPPTFYNSESEDAQLDAGK